MTDAKKVKVTPAKGLLVRKQDGKHLKADGEIVRKSAFWVKRFKAGEVTMTEVKADTRAKASTSSTTNAAKKGA